MPALPQPASATQLFTFCNCMFLPLRLLLPRATGAPRVPNVFPLPALSDGLGGATCILHAGRAATHLGDLERSACLLDGSEAHCGNADAWAASPCGTVGAPCGRLHDAGDGGGGCAKKEGAGADAAGASAASTDAGDGTDVSADSACAAGGGVWTETGAENAGGGGRNGGGRRGASSCRRGERFLPCALRLLTLATRGGSCSDKGGCCTGGGGGGKVTGRSAVVEMSLPAATAGSGGELTEARNVSTSMTPRGHDSCDMATSPVPPLAGATAALEAQAPEGEGLVN